MKQPFSLGSLPCLLEEPQGSSTIRVLSKPLIFLKDGVFNSVWGENDVVLYATLQFFSLLCLVHNKTHGSLKKNFHMPNKLELFCFH